MLESGAKKNFANSFLGLSSFLENPDELNHIGLYELSATERKKSFLDALGSWVWESQFETSAYRWRGEDTLTWGNIDRWILVEWVRNILEGYQNVDELRHHRQYNVLGEIVEQVRLSEIDSYYQFRGKEVVRNYLLDHPAIIDFLKDSYLHLNRFFEDEATYLLEVVQDPEDTHQTLFVYICTSLAIEQALSALNKFDEEWFLKQIDRVNNSINFNLEIR